MRELWRAAISIPGGGAARRARVVPRALLAYAAVTNDAKCGNARLAAGAALPKLGAAPLLPRDELRGGAWLPAGAFALSAWRHQRPRPPSMSTLLRCRHENVIDTITEAAAAAYAASYAVREKASTCWKQPVTKRGENIGLTKCGERRHRRRGVSREAARHHRRRPAATIGVRRHALLRA